MIKFLLSREEMEASLKTHISNEKRFKTSYTPRKITDIQNLFERALESHKFDMNHGASEFFDEYLYNYKPYFGACCCVGKESSRDIACRCAMRELIQVHRFEIILYAAIVSRHTTVMQEGI